jgi:hypothetical protein
MERLCIHDLSNPLYKTLFTTLIWLVLAWYFMEKSCIRTSTLVPVSPEQMARLEVLSQYHQLLINLKQKVLWAYTLFTNILITKGYKNWASGIIRIDKMFHIWVHHECVACAFQNQAYFLFVLLLSSPAQPKLCFIGSRRLVLLVQELLPDASPHCLTDIFIEKVCKNWNSGITRIDKTFTYQSIMTMRPVPFKIKYIFYLPNRGLLLDRTYKDLLHRQ